MINVVGIVVVALAHLAAGANFRTVTLAPNDPTVLHIKVNKSIKLTTKVTDNTGSSFYIFEIHTRDRELKLADKLVSLRSYPKPKISYHQHNVFQIKTSHITKSAHAGITVFPTTIDNTTEAPYAFVSNDIQIEFLDQVNVSFIALIREYPKTAPVPGICTKGNNKKINNRPALQLYYGAEMGERERDNIIAVELL